MLNTTGIDSSRFASAVVKYFERKGYSVTRVDDEWIDLIAVEGDTVALVAISASEGGFANLPIERDCYEKSMLSFAVRGLMPPDCGIRFDSVSVCCLGDKALIRHHLNAFGE